MDTSRMGTPDYAAILRGMLRRHKRLVAATFLGLAVPLLAIIFYTWPPLYESTATLLLESSPVMRMPNLEMPGGDGIATAITLLKSRSLSEGVIEALPKESFEELLTHAQYTDYMLSLTNQVKKWMGKPITVLSPQQRAVAELQHARMDFSRETRGDFRSPAIVMIRGIASNPRVAMDLVNTHIQVLLSRTRNVNQEEVRKAREFLEAQTQQVKENLSNAEDALTKFQQQRGRVRLGAQTELDLVSLSQAENALAEAQASRAVLAARINGLRQVLEGKLKEPGHAGEKGKDESPNATQASEIMIKLNQFKAAQDRLANLEAKLASMRERYTEAYPLLQVTQEEVTAAQARLAQLARELPSNPSKEASGSRTALTGQTERAEALRQLATLEADDVALQSKVETAKIQVDRLQKSLRSLSQDEVGYSNLRRSVEAQRNLLTVLSDKLMGTRIQEQGDGRIVRVIDPASFPLMPTQSKAQKLALMALVLAAGIAFGAGFGLEFWRQPVETESDVQRATRLAVLGSVGVIGGQAGQPLKGRAQPPQMPLYLPGSSTGGAIHLELYRAIRGAIETERLKGEFRSILVTSPGPGEGKSTSVLNLAHVLEEYGRRVLIVEADLRRPTLHRVLGITNKPGLVDFLRGTATFGQICRVLPSGVSLIPGQVTREDAGSLLASSRIRELLAVAKAQFDVILVDSAPLLAVPDNFLLFSVLDRVILVAKASQTSIRELRQAESIAERANAQILGVILNHANQRDVHYYHRRYSKYYRSSNGKKDPETTKPERLFSWRERN